MYTITGDIVTPDGVLENGALTVDDAGNIAEVGPQPDVPARSGDIDAHGPARPARLCGHARSRRRRGGLHARDGRSRPAGRPHPCPVRHDGAAGDDDDGLAGRHGRAITAAREVIEAGPGEGEARVLGIHLEGPYICAAKRGAQPLAFVRPPDAEELAHWIALVGRRRSGRSRWPRRWRARRKSSGWRGTHGVIVSIGHTDAKAADVLRAIGWGATQATHTFNAMRGLHHREPGTVGAVLTQPEVVCEIIADGVHLDPLIVQLIVAAKGTAGAVLITDAIEGAAMPDGEYALGGQTVFVQERHGGLCRRDSGGQRPDHEPGLRECPPLRRGFGARTRPGCPAAMRPGSWG